VRESPAKLTASKSQKAQRRNQGPAENESCGICLSLDVTASNPMRVCEMCLCMVHDKCYEKPIVLTGDKNRWYCARCTYMTANSKAGSQIVCVLCNNLRGVLRSLSNGKWVHTLCVKWIPELKFSKSLTEVTGNVLT